MTSSAKLRKRAATYKDLSEIFSALKNLSYAELQKTLLRVERGQSLAAVLGQMEADVGGILSTSPGWSAPSVVCLSVLIGTERGFSGPLNRMIASYADDQGLWSSDPIVVGSKLAAQVEGQTSSGALAGVHSCDELEAVVTQVVDALYHRMKRSPASLPQIRVVYGADEGGSLKVHEDHLWQSLWQPPADGGSRPEIYLDTTALVAGFVEQHTHIKMMELITLSYLAECRCRLALADQALHHLDRKSLQLKSQLNRWRQEQITEEIETILLAQQST